jgi:quinol monooxygenase YgiN
MYGTIAKIHTNPDNVPALRSLAQSMGTAPGQLGRFVFQMDADPQELWLVAVFESKEAYWANAASPEQHQRFLQLRALIDGDPEWHDGEIIDAAMSGG